MVTHKPYPNSQEFGYKRRTVAEFARIRLQPPSAEFLQFQPRRTPDSENASKSSELKLAKSSQSAPQRHDRRQRADDNRSPRAQYKPPLQILRVNNRISPRPAA